MKVSRRDLLKAASASAVLAGQPAGGLLRAASASGGAAGELFAVVSPGKAWAVCGSYHEAYHQANLISHTNIVQTAHVRCSRAFAEQMKSGSLKSFVEIDGWAMTGGEAETRGFQFLRNAVDRIRARSQLLAHYRGVALDKVNERDRELTAAMWYAEVQSDGGTIVAVGNTSSEIETDAEVTLNRCTAGLGGQLQTWLDEGGQLPGIIKQSDLHMSFEEHADRIDDDPVFRFATLGMTSHSASDDTGTGCIAFDRTDNWIYGVGSSREAAIENAGWARDYTGGSELVVTRASAVLCKAVRQQGLELPVFWTQTRGVARHESELRSSRMPNRRKAVAPPRPEWKR